MKASVIRSLAAEHDAETLQAAIDAFIEEERDILGVPGEDDGERLTHCNLALRVRQRVDQGEDLRLAFRDVLGEVRALLQNE
ncbi:MAG: hypothetical protein EA397_17535 [Deltaproteobacteria bacterium]|nr:MAG: hypothetical protein EA397_17535 [Deltaproteobacteria bacterium]